MRITSALIDPALLDLPWHIPLEDWPADHLVAAVSAWTARDLEGRRLQDFVHPDDVAATMTPAAASPRSTAICCTVIAAPSSSFDHVATRHVARQRHGGIFSPAMTAKKA